MVPLSHSLNPLIFERVGNAGEPRGQATSKRRERLYLNFEIKYRRPSQFGSPTDLRNDAGKRPSSGDYHRFPGLDGGVGQFERYNLKSWAACVYHRFPGSGWKKGNSGTVFFVSLFS